jgi:hypothetical protein
MRNSKFQLKDGSIIDADYLMYGESKLFSYSTATFIKENWFIFQIETDKPVERSYLKG